MAKSRCVQLVDNTIWIGDIGYHREDGPAVEFTDLSPPQWWLNGHWLSFSVWCMRLNKSEAEKAQLLLEYEL